jgi:hypothetical protein
LIPLVYRFETYCPYILSIGSFDTMCGLLGSSSFHSVALECLASGFSDNLPSFLSLLESVPPYLACEAIYELRRGSEEFESLYQFLGSLFTQDDCVCRSLFMCLPLFGPGNHAMDVVGRVTRARNREISKAALICAIELVEQIGEIQEHVIVALCCE